MQHGESKSKEDGPARSLTDKGRSEVERVAAFLARTAQCESMPIRHSGKTRARETAEALARTLEAATVEETDGLAPLDDPALWAERLSETDEGVVLVGHLPHLARLTSLLLASDPERGIVEVSNAGMVCLQRNEDGHWALRWSVVPALLG
jgi:phosphohistidine phosphatase